MDTERSFSTPNHIKDQPSASPFVSKGSGVKRIGVVSYADENDPPAGFTPLPGAGFSYRIERTRWMDEVAYLLQLPRLNHVHQLHWIRSMKRQPDGTWKHGDRYSHTRARHHEDVLAVANLLCHRVKFDARHEHDTRLKFHVLLTAYTHDAATIAYGDMAKHCLVDMSEESLLELKTRDERWRKFAERYQILTALYLEIVQDKHWLAKFVDFPDRFAYVCRDGHTVICEDDRVAHPLNQWEQAFANRPSKETGFGELLSSVHVKDRSVLYDRPDSLRAFFEQRLYQFRMIYHDIERRAHPPYVLASLLLPFLFENVEVASEYRLTRSRLLEMNDRDLDAFLCRFLAVAKWDDVAGHVQVNEFEHKKDAEAFIVESREKHGNPYLVMIDLRGELKTCTELLILQNGSISPFRILFPDESAQLTALCARSQTYSVLTLTDHHLPSTLTNQLLVFQKARGVTRAG